MRKISYFVAGFLLALTVNALAAVTVFPDVPVGVYYKEGVDFLVEKGVIKGYSDGTFQPANYVNRADMATMLYRYDQAKDENENELIIHGVKWAEMKNESNPPLYQVDFIFKTTKKAKAKVKLGESMVEGDAYNTMHALSVNLGLVSKEELPKVFKIDLIAESEDGELAGESIQYVIAE